MESWLQSLGLHFNPADNGSGSGSGAGPGPGSTTSQLMPVTNAGRKTTTAEKEGAPSGSSGQRNSAATAYASEGPHSSVTEIVPVTDANPRASGSSPDPKPGQQTDYAPVSIDSSQELDPSATPEEVIPKVDSLTSHPSIAAQVTPADAFTQRFNASPYYRSNPSLSAAPMSAPLLSEKEAEPPEAAEDAGQGFSFLPLSTNGVEADFRGADAKEQGKNGEASAQEDRVPAADSQEEVAQDSFASTSATGSLVDLIKATPVSSFQPLEFFVAWQGVLTVAYSGLPPALENLKSLLNDKLPFLAPENPGSKWPKTTLGCLRDKQRLSLPQLEVLRKICSDESFQLAAGPRVEVHALSIVVYENCCLESTICQTPIFLCGPKDGRGPSAQQVANTRQVMEEFATKNLPSYWFHVSKDGNRSAHYRKSKVGVSLVHFLSSSLPIARFRKRVDEALPEMYDWFSEQSLHITLRALS